MKRLFVIAAMFAFLCAPSLWAVAGCDGSGNCYIYASATGSGNGSNWTNAYTGFGTTAGKINPASMTRGVTYWIANGSYGSQTFSSPDSGILVVTIEGATTASHGPAGDWNNSFAGSALFSGDDNINTDYWTINGQAVPGCTYPSNNASCYTIKLWNQTDTGGDIVGLGGGVGHITMEYLELEGTGMTGGAFPNNTTADKCTTDGCGAVSDVGINEPTSPVNNIYFGYSYIHHVGTNMFLFNVTGVGTSVNQTVTWDHNWFAYNHTGQNGLHTESGSMYVAGFTVSYNILQDISGSGEITTAGAATPALNNWDIYGNLFFWDSTYAALAGSFHEATIDDGVIDFLGEKFSGFIHFYNNTMAGFNNSVATGVGSPFSTIAVDANSGFSTCGSSCPTVQIYNNLWWDSAWVTGDYPAYCSIVTGATCTQDYDAIYYGSVPSADVGAPSETHGYVVTTTASPFVNATLSTIAGFELTTPDPFLSHVGTSLGSPYNVDMLGVTFGANGTLDRGALQLPAASSASARRILFGQ